MICEDGVSELLVGNNSPSFVEELEFKSTRIAKNAPRINFMNGHALNIDEQNNDDVERVARRRSRLIEPHPDVVNSPAHNTARRQAIASTQELLLPRAQVGEHYGNCIRLAAENKITHKNAFDLHLIDFMSEMIKKEDFTSFRMASSSLDASAKIYAGRVDAVHQETYKVLTGLGRSDKDNKDDVEDTGDGLDSDKDDNSDAAHKAAKTKSKRGPIAKPVIVTNVSKIRAKVKASDADVDPLFQQQAAAYDDGGTVELRLNQLGTYSKFSELLLDSSTPLFRELEQESLACSTQPADITSLLENPRAMEAPLCLAFDHLYFGQYDTSSGLEAGNKSPLFIPDTYSNDSGTATPIPCGSPISSMNVAPCGDDIYDEDDNHHDALNLTKVEEVAAKTIGTDISGDIIGEGEIFVASLKSMLSNHFENFGQVNDGILGLWAGPEHWRKKAKRRRLDEFGNVAAAADGDDKVVDAVKSSRTKSIKKKELKIDFSAAYLDAVENVSDSSWVARNDWSKQLTTYSKLSGKSTVLRDQNRRQANERFNLLPPSIADARQHLYELNNREVMYDIRKKGCVENQPPVNNQLPQGVVLCPPWMDEQLAGENAGEEVSMDNPIHMDDDDEDDMAPFDDFFTQPSSYHGDERAQVASEEDGQVDLVAPPRQIAQLSIGYARSAKLINMRQLKAVLWSLIETDLCHDPAKTQQVHQNREPEEEDDTIPFKTQRLEEPPVDNAVDSLEVYFSNLLTTLPEKVSKQTASELSVAMGLNCLLHLANEKDLMLESVLDCTDIRVSHGLSDTELANMAAFRTQSGNLRPKKQLSLDPWLEGDDE